MERCKHGTYTIFCAFCKPPAEEPSNERRPATRKDRTVFGVAALNGKELERTGYVVIKARKDHHSFRDLNNETLFVHIDGMPFLWAIELILKLAINVRTIQVIPSMLRKMHPDSHLRLCRERDVEVRSGHHRPNMAWKPGENRSPFYDRQQEFFRAMEGEQRILFEELLAMNFDATAMTARYFCLDGEEYTAQRLLAEEYGFGEDERQVSMRINAVIYYLDPSFDAGDRSKQFADVLKRRVERMRPFLKSAELRQRLCAEIGIPRLPEKLPIARVPVFRELLQARKDGRLNRLMIEHNRLYRIITLRFGIEQEEPTQYRRHETIGETFAVSRQRVFQLEADALRLLGIEDES